MLGGYYMSFNLMIVGRIIFGIGTESMYIGQVAITAVWFLDYELPFAISMINSLPLLGGISAGVVIPRVFQKQMVNK